MTAHVGQVLAEWVAAMWTLLLIAVAWVASLVMVWRSGRVFERRQIDAGRARVRAGMEAASAKTVPIPQQRQGVDR